MLIAALVACVCADPAPAAAPTAAKAPPGVARTARKGAELFGINEAVSIPKLFLDDGRISPAEEPALLAQDAAAAAHLGAAIVRSNTANYPYLDHLRLARSGWDWRRADAWVAAVQAAGLDALVMIGPWPGNATAGFTTAYVPTDLPAYAAYVRRVVERYDGDGVDDMPGLQRKIRYWEVDNEPDLHNSKPPKNGPQRIDPALFERPDEYAAVLLASAQAIRQADPEAVVLSAGFFRPHHPQGAAYARAVFDDPAVVAAVDVFSAHVYFEEDGIEPLARALQLAAELLPGKPVWITETSVPSDPRKPHIDEAWQGKMVAAIIGAALAGGADRVFWHTLADPPWAKERSGAPFSTHSLLATTAPGPGSVVGGVVDKPAGAVYRRLAALLRDTDPAVYREEAAAGGRLLWTGAGWLAFWGSPSLPPGAGVITDLRTGEVLTAAVAPAWIASQK